MSDVLNWLALALIIFFFTGGVWTCLSWLEGWMHQWRVDRLRRKSESLIRDLVPEPPSPDKLEPSRGVVLAVKYCKESPGFEIFIPDIFDADELIATIDDTREMERKK